MPVDKDALLAVHSQIDSRLRKAEIVEDVMNRRVTCGIGMPVVWIQGTTGKGDTAPSVGATSKYLMKGSLETDKEYEQRLKMTPYFPETPRIVAERIGAIFSEKPLMDGEDKDQYANFEKEFTQDKKSLQEAAAMCGSWMMRVGFSGILLDTKPLDPETKRRAQEGAVSQEEVEQRRLNDPRATVYAPKQILDFDYGSDGELIWVKVIEHYAKRESWDMEPEQIRKIRVIDKQKISTWEMNDKDEIVSSSVVFHNAGFVPFVFVSSPVDTWGPLGGSMLLESAEADVVATRLLSDATWCLFVLGQPILGWWTNDDDSKVLQAGAGRYVRFKPGSGQREGEDMRFIQLDENGIRLLLETHDMTKQLGRTLAGKVGDAVIQDAPPQISGVSRAWQFKTGEERVLFLITFALESAFNKVLDMYARLTKRDPAKIKIVFAQDFDLGDPKQTIENAEKVLKIASGYDMPKTKEIALRKIVDTLGGVPMDEERVMDAEIKAAAKQEAEIESNGINTINERESGGRNSKNSAIGESE